MAILENLEKGSIGLIQEQQDGSIVQIGLSPEQSRLLQVFLSTISKERKLVRMPDKYNLIMESKCTA